jgi:predicted nucleic acid-binding protein
MVSPSDQAALAHSPADAPIDEEDPLDKQIAATALIHDLTVVSRNIARCGITAPNG